MEKSCVGAASYHLRLRGGTRGRALAGPVRGKVGAWPGALGEREGSLARLEPQEETGLSRAHGPLASGGGGCGSPPQVFLLAAVVVVQNATVLDLKKAIQRYVQLRQEREGGVQHISWSYVWRTYHLMAAGEKLTEDRKKLRDYGIRNRDEVSFIKKLRQK
uniref:Small nuclear ribonucleoprotein U11/U12 subunit 25 n=1 Tax=Sus scrofa TaxID=9823 RepID=A0A8D0XKA4_PIG